MPEELATGNVAIPEKMILATKNENKLREMREILMDNNIKIEIISPEEAGINIEIEETGTSFMENALLKAKALCEASGLPAIGDDSGLCVDALNGAPGIYSARYGGPGLTDAARCQLVLRAMRGATSRAAHFTCAVAAAFPNGSVVTAERRCDGAIAFAALGTGGFGYDAIFLIPEQGKTFGQLSPEEKNAISHRGKALAAFVKALENYLSPDAPENQGENPGENPDKKQDKNQNEKAAAGNQDEKVLETGNA